MKLLFECFMDVPIQFNGELDCVTIEIYDVIENGVLSSELHSHPVI